MACEVKNCGMINGIDKVQQYFGLSHDENWFNSVNYSISPTNDMIALAMGEKLAFLQLSTFWDDGSQASTNFTLSWCGELEDPNQIVTAILCLPMYGKSVSSGSEWTCVVLGLASGMIVFYTDAGVKIFSQSFHEEQVLSIKAFTPPKHSEADSFMYIVYDDCVCIIKGSDIFAILSSQRHAHHRTFDRNLTKDSNAGENASQPSDVMNYYKYNFKRDRETIVNDAVIAGPQLPLTYDHIIEQCLSCGYYAKIAETPVHSSLVLGCGAEPYLGFYAAEEGYKTISIREVAKDVIGMAYKNIFGNFFGKNAKNSNQNPESPEELPSPSKEASMRTLSKLYDGKRDGYHIILSPNGRLAAVTDNLDRVMLIDTQQTIILRVWKGYKDAQVAFITVKEKSLKGVHTHRRKTMFLVIYAPRLGCLEIWSLQNGPKVAAFNVGKNGILSYNTHGVFGVPANTKFKANINQCIFIDSSDGSIKDIHIPFHCALTGTNSKTSKDIHLLRRLKQILRDSKSEDTFENVREIANGFQTIEVRQQCLEMLLKNKKLKPEVFKIIIYAFAEALENESADSKDSTQCEDLRIMIENYKRLVDFYLNMQSPVEEPFDDYINLPDCDLVIINQLVLLLKDKTIKSLPIEVDNNKNNVNLVAGTTSKVTFQEHCKNDGDFVEYLSIFQVDSPDAIRLLPDKKQHYADVSAMLLAEFFDKGLSFTQFKTEAELVQIPCEDLLVLALNFWTGRPFDYQNCDEVIADMSRLAAIIRTICELAGEKVSDYAYNGISPWWQDVRELLLESPKSLSLLVAIVCKTVATTLWRNKRDGSCDENSLTEGDEEHWEKITNDEAQWGLLIGKLEDVAVLGAIVEYPLTSLEPIMPELHSEIPECSLKFIVNSGKGIVSELTAKWLINSRIHPKAVLEATPKEKDTSNEDDKTKTADEKLDDALAIKEKKEDENACDMSKDLLDPIIQKLNLLREHFPFSLESGMILTQMAWQYMVHWSKNLQSLEHMRAANLCLAQFKESDYALKHGVCCMLWNATLKYPLQNTAKLIQKVGRLPTDKMCQQGIEISAGLVPEFLEQSLEFLEHFSTSLNHDKRKLRFEESLAEGQLPLQFIALQQHNAMRELLELQFQLSTVLYFITFFQLKMHKPLTTVFDGVANKAFFVEINKELNFVLTAPDIVLQQLRRDFLCKVIAASMDLIREDLEQLYMEEHKFFMTKIYSLAESWHLDTQPLKREQVIQLYAHGYDHQAEILYEDIKYDTEIGRSLLEIAGRRMKLYTRASQSAYLKMASVGQQLLQYLDNLKENDSMTVSDSLPSYNSKAALSIQITATSPDEIGIEALTKLVENCYTSLSVAEAQAASSVHIAAQMFDACSLLQE